MKKLIASIVMGCGLFGLSYIAQAVVTGPSGPAPVVGGQLNCSLVTSYAKTSVGVSADATLYPRELGGGLRGCMSAPIAGFAVASDTTKCAGSIQFIRSNKISTCQLLN